MRKILASFLSAVTMVSVSIPVFTAKAYNVTVSPNYTAVVSQEPSATQYSLAVNGIEVNLGTLNIVKIKNRIMVPLQITSESLGFAVSEDKKKHTIHLDDGNMQTDLTIGDDSYFAYSSKAIGMIASISLGVAPTNIKGYTYVPVDFYKILLTDPDCVQVKSNVINISSKLEKSDKFPVSSGMPNPLVNYNTLDEARKALGFTFAVPATAPNGYKMQDIIVINNDVAEIFYTSGNKKFLYRTAKGNGDISGDYVVYDLVKKITVDNADVTIKGKGDNISLATWVKNGMSFSLRFDEAVNQKTLSSIIESIK